MKTLEKKCWYLDCNNDVDYSVINRGNYKHLDGTYSAKNKVRMFVCREHLSYMSHILLNVWHHCQTLTIKAYKK